MTTKLFQRLAKYPPVLIRLLARNPDGSAMTDAQITQAGCPRSVVRGLGCSTEWTSNAKDSDLFLSSCGADPLDADWVRRTNRFLGRPVKWTWLRRSPLWKSQFIDLLKIYASTL